MYKQIAEKIMRHQEYVDRKFCIPRNLQRIELLSEKLYFINNARKH